MFERFFLLLGDQSGSFTSVKSGNTSLSKDFLRLLDSFDFVQWVSGPTHAQGHTLDLILSRGMSVLDITIEDAGISDHLPILFSLSLDGNTPSQSSLPSWTRIFTDCSSKEFSSKYELLGATQDMNTLTGHLDVNRHLGIFNNNCSNILHHFSIKDEKQTIQYLGIMIPLVPLGRLVEGRNVSGKKIGYKSHEILRDSFSAFQRSAKAAKCRYFSGVNHTKKKAISQIFYFPLLSLHSIQRSTFFLRYPSLCENFAIILMTRSRKSCLLYQ